MSNGAEAFPSQDELALEQIRSDLDVNLLVEAGAGTGKTRSLVGRYVALALNGAPVERIAAITFTEKAAAELRERVRLGLEDALPRSEEEAARIAGALQSLERAQISTIHSFCQSLLRAFAAEAGIDPDFEVLDEMQAQRRFQERWRIFLDSMETGGNAVSSIDRALALGLGVAHMQTLAWELSARPELLPLIHTLGQPDAPVWPDIALFQRELASLSLDSVSDGDRLKQRLSRLSPLLAAIGRSRSDRESALAAGAGVLALKFAGSGTQGNWGSKQALNQARELAAGIADSLNAALTACRAQALADLMPLIAGFVDGEMAARRSEGALTFNDLILMTRDVLRESRAARQALRQRYHTLLLDEFQDTDPLQMEIARMFGENPDTGILQAGRLFLVGDPKQSIYRFRRADIGMYQRTQDLLAQAGAGFLELAINRRSRDVILHWVNAVFERLIGAGEQPQLQQPYRPIHAFRTEPLAGPGVARLGGLADTDARTVRDLEAAAIVQRCRAVLDEGWQVSARDGSVRRAQLRDIAILIRSRSVLLPLQRAFAAAGTPYLVEGGSLVLRTQEVRDLLNCLSAIDDPADEVAVVAALRSPIFACSDVDLVRHRAQGGRFDYESPRTGDGLVGDALAVLRFFHDQRYEKSLAALIEDFLANRGLWELGILDQGDRNAYRRLRFVVEQARAFESNAPQSLRSFVQWMERQASVEVFLDEGAGQDDDEDAVHIFTIHGSKGLEFPIVFLAGLGSGIRAGYHAPPLLADLADGQLAVSIGPKGQHGCFQIGPVDMLAEQDKIHADAEYMRLLYVAATRARDHLVVSLFHPKSVSGSGAAALIGAGVPDLCPALPEPGPVAAGGVAPFAGLEADLPAAVNGGGFWEQRAALVESARSRVFTSATALGKHFKESPPDVTEPWARGRGGTHVGRAVHAAIQSLALTPDDAEIAAFSRAQALAEAIPARAVEVEELVRRAFASVAAQRARTAARALRETPFAVRQGQTIVEGFIDMVIETAAGLEIVDWKTDDVGEEDMETRLLEYRTQAGLYVLGLESATGKRVNAVTYVFVRAGKERSMDDPALLAAEARQKLASLPQT